MPHKPDDLSLISENLHQWFPKKMDSIKLFCELMHVHGIHDHTYIQYPHHAQQQKKYTSWYVDRITTLLFFI